MAACPPLPRTWATALPNSRSSYRCASTSQRSAPPCASRSSSGCPYVCGAKGWGSSGGPVRLACCLCAGGPHKQGSGWPGAGCCQRRDSGRLVKGGLCAALCSPPHCWPGMRTLVAGPPSAESLGMTEASRNFSHLRISMGTSYLQRWRGSSSRALGGAALGGAPGWRLRRRATAGPAARRGSALPLGLTCPPAPSACGTRSRRAPALASPGTAPWQGGGGARRLAGRGIWQGWAAQGTGTLGTAGRSGRAAHFSRRCMSSAASSTRSSEVLAHAAKASLNTLLQHASMIRCACSLQPSRVSSTTSEFAAKCSSSAVASSSLIATPLRGSALAMGGAAPGAGVPAGATSADMAKWVALLEWVCVTGARLAAGPQLGQRAMGCCRVCTAPRLGGDVGRRVRSKAIAPFSTRHGAPALIRSRAPAPAAIGQGPTLSAAGGGDLPLPSPSPCAPCRAARCHRCHRRKSPGPHGGPRPKRPTAQPRCDPSARAESSCRGGREPPRHPR
jgi:hypothetical protein